MAARSPYGHVALVRRGQYDRRPLTWRKGEKEATGIRVNGASSDK